MSYASFLTEPEVPAETLVPCSEAHQAYSFDVSQLEGGVATPATGTTEADLQSEGKFACGQSFTREFPKNAGGNSRIVVGVVVEPQSSWGSGPLWVRCDVLELAIGSPYLSPALADLPSSGDAFVTSVNQNPTAYRFCVNTPNSNGNTGPILDSTSLIASCASAQWTAEPSPNFPDPPGEAYPGYDKLESSWMHAHCGLLYDSAATRGWVFYPSASQWATGDRDFECWVGKR